jgi:hypothetical protein
MGLLRLRAITDASFPYAAYRFSWLARCEGKAYGASCCRLRVSRHRYHHSYAFSSVPLPYQPVNSHEDKYDAQYDERDALGEFFGIMLKTSGKHIGGRRADRGFDA